jgi:hypothetical protein
MNAYAMKPPKPIKELVSIGVIVLIGVWLWQDVSVAILIGLFVAPPIILYWYMSRRG